MWAIRKCPLFIVLARVSRSACHLCMCTRSMDTITTTKMHKSESTNCQDIANRKNTNGQMQISLSHCSHCRTEHKREIKHTKQRAFAIILMYFKLGLIIEIHILECVFGTTTEIDQPISQPKCKLIDDKPHQRVRKRWMNFLLEINGMCCVCMSNSNMWQSHSQHRCFGWCLFCPICDHITYEWWRASMHSACTLLNNNYILLHHVGLYE